MATECEVNKSRRFDLGMSRRTRRSTSLVASCQDQHVPPQMQQLRQNENLKTLFQCQDIGLQPPYPYEDQELRILQAPLQFEADEQKTPNQHINEQEEKLHHYLDQEQEKKLHQQQDGERKKPRQYHDEEQNTLQQCHQDEEKTPLQYQDEEEKTPNQYEGEEENTPGQYEDEEQKTAEQCQEEEENQNTSAKNQDEEHKALKAHEQCQDTEQKKTLEQYKRVKNLITPPCASSMPRFSLQELIQEKQLLTGEAKVTSKLGHGEKAVADHKVSPAPVIGGTTLAMVLKRPDGGKKSMGVIRRCVKALNQMIKTKHGSKKNTPF